MSPAKLPATNIHPIIERWKFSSRFFAQSHTVTQIITAHSQTLHFQGTVMAASSKSRCLLYSIEVLMNSAGSSHTRLHRAGTTWMV